MAAEPGEREVRRYLRLIEDLLQRLATAEEHAWPVEPGSVLAGDDRRSGTTFHVSSHAASGISTAVEHLHALHSLIIGAGVLHMGAPFALLRVAIETASTTVWLLQPSSRVDRILRMLSLELADAYDLQMATQSMQAPAPEKRYAERIAELRTLARQLTGDPQTNLNQPGSVPLVKAGQTAVTEDARLLAAWRVCAGFAHGRRWAQLAMLDRETQPSTRPGIADVRFTGSFAKLSWPLGAAVLVTQAAWSSYTQRSQPPALSRASQPRQA